MNDQGRIIFLIVFAIAFGFVYYRFVVLKNSPLNKLVEYLANIWETQKVFLRPHAKLIFGILLIVNFQYHLSKLVLEPIYFLGEQGFITDALFHIARLGISDPIITIASYLLLLAGCCLLFSAFRDFGTVPKEERPSALFIGGTPAFFKGRQILLPILSFMLLGYLLWHLYRYPFIEPYLVGIWLVEMLVFCYFAARLDLQHGVFFGPHIRRSDAIWIALLFLLGLIVGMYRLQSLPNQFMGDEGSFWELAANTASGAVQPLFFGNGVYSFPNLSSIGQAFVLMIFGISVWSWRFSSLLAGLLTVIPLYLLARELFGRQVAIVSCVLMVTLEYFLAFSRLGYNNSQSLFPVTLALYFIIMGVKRSSMLYFYLAGCAAGLGFYTYTASRSALIIILLFMLTLSLQNRMAKRNIFKAMLVVGVGWCLLASPLLVFNSTYSPETVNMKLAESIFFNTDFSVPLYPRERIVSAPDTILFGDGGYFFNLQIYAQLIARGFLRTLLSFNIAAGLVREHFITAPLAGLAGAAFFTLGMLFSMMRYRERSHYLLLYWFAVNIILLSTLNTFPPRHQHMVSVIPLIALWTALGLVSTVNGLLQVFFRSPKLRNICIAALTIVLAIIGLDSYFVKMPIAYQPTQEQIVSWAALYAQDEKIIYVYEKPDENLKQPSFMQFIRPDFPYSAIPLSELPTQLDGKTIVFFPPNIASQVESVIQSTRMEIRVQRTFYYAEDIPILAGVANFATNFGAPSGLLADLSDSYIRPGFWLVFLVIIFLVFAISFRTSWLNHAPRWVKRTHLWLTSESPV